MSSNERALVDIALTALFIQDIVQGKTKKNLFDDIGMQAALKYKIGVIGEAVKRLSRDFRNEHPTIPWQQIAGMRDIVDTNITMLILTLFGTSLNVMFLLFSNT